MDMSNLKYRQVANPSESLSARVRTRGRMQIAGPSLSDVYVESYVESLAGIFVVFLPQTSCHVVGQLHTAASTMPQIDFQPPLATTTTVHLPPLSVLGSAKDSRITLSFVARPIDGLSEEDVIEIWTDGGTPGSWRAVQFKSHGEDGILVAQIPVDIADGSFGFTYRVTHASGDASWLGDMGGNGKIDLISTEGEDALWKGEDWLKFDKEHWTGFAVQLDEK